MDAAAKEQRENTHLSYRLPFQLNISTGREIFSATGLNLFHSGMQIETTAPLVPEMDIKIWPANRRLIGNDIAQGKIQWIQPAETAGIRCGINFTRKVHWPIVPSPFAKTISLDHKAEVSRDDSDGPTTASDFILDSMIDGVFSVDTTWHITSFNRAAELLTGWPREWAIGRPCREVFKSSACGEGCVLAESIREGVPLLNKTLFITHADGQRISATISTTPLVNTDGEIIGGLQIFRDVRTLMDQALILDNIADGVFSVDKQWRITSFNRAAERITGIPAADALGRPCDEIFQESICGESCAIAESMCTGKPEGNRSIFIKNVEGKNIPVSICAAPLLDNLGNLIGGVETFRDLSLTRRRQPLSGRHRFEKILSKNAAMKRLFDILPPIARSDSNVLVIGESGTGKELVAKAIHNLSDHRKKPFVAVNCGALPDTLLEAELFGYKAGAFTDAKGNRPGRFAAAEGGTLLLDEIGDIALAVQVKLLRVIETKQYEPLGSSVAIPANVRIVAATNRDLETLVHEGKFRDDLFYRLNVAKLYLPPLRERSEDILLLIDHFIMELNDERCKDIGGISEPALVILMDYDFPGNVRELHNIIEYAFILCPGGLIQPEHLPEPFAPGAETPSDDLDPLVTGRPVTLEQIEKRTIHQALQRNQWRRMATCRDLDISKDTLRRKIERYGLDTADK